MNHLTIELTIEEAARRSGVSVRTIYRWIDHGLLPTVERAHGRRIPSDALAQVRHPRRSRTAATDGDVRSHVLGAAMAVVAADGAAALTLERVAAQAGMSVGGVTYHFPTKSALIDGLVVAFLDGFETGWAAARAAGRSAADAYIAMSVDGLGRGGNPGTRAVLLAALDEPDARRRIDRRLKRWYREIAGESSDPEADLRRCLAADALWLFEVLGLRPLPHRSTAAIAAPRRSR